MFGIMLEDYAWWLVAALLLGIAEMILPGIFLIWLAGAALVTGVATLLLGLLPAFQFALFSVAAIGAVYAGRRWLRDHPVATSDPLLNDRVARIVGRTVLVCDPILGGEGRVRVDDGVWPAIGPDAPSGTRVRVVGAEGGRLRIELI